MEYITIQNKQIPYTTGVVTPKQAQLDPANPRIQYMIGYRATNATEETLEELLWAKDPVKALAQSILQNGGVYDRIIVQRKGDRYLVREGNSRTVATRHLAEQFPGDARFATMPAMIFDVDLTEEDLAVLLADMHVAGKIKWDAYEQAKHISDLYNIYGKTYDWLSNHLRLSKSKITGDLLAYQATSEYLTTHPDPINVQKFAFFQELMRKKPLKEQFQNDLEFKQRFHRWIEQGKLNASVQVRDLDTILAIPEAAKALDKDGAKAAQAVLVRNDPALDSDLFLAIKKATQELKEAPASDIQDIKGENPQKLLMLRNLHRAVEDLATLAGVKL